MTTTTITRLHPRHRLGAHDVQERHHDDDQHGEDLDPAVAAVGDRRARVAAERHRDHAGDDGVRGEDQPGDDAGDVAVAEAAGDVLEHPAGRRVARAELGERVALQHRDAPAIRNDSHTAAPATSPAAPSSEKIPAPTIAPTPMNAA